MNIITRVNCLIMNITTRVTCTTNTIGYSVLLATAILEAVNNSWRVSGTTRYHSGMCPVPGQRTRVLPLKCSHYNCTIENINIIPMEYKLKNTKIAIVNMVTVKHLSISVRVRYQIIWMKINFRRRRNCVMNIQNLQALFIVCRLYG